MEHSSRNWFQKIVERQDQDLFAKLPEFKRIVEDLKRDDLYPFHRPLTLASGAQTEVRPIKTEPPKKVVMMGANNYLDLSNDPAVKRAALAALEEYGYGSGSTSLLAGTLDLHNELEDTVSRFYGRESTILFPTGYSANVGTVSALIRKGDLALLDVFAHKSIVEGVQLSGADSKVFRHNDMDSLERILKRKRSEYNGVLIAVDGVFSMDGDICPLDRLVELKNKYNARLLVDEAHSIGMIGPNGKGIEDYFGMPGAVDVLLGTFSKAPGVIGGYVTGSLELTTFLRHFANAYMFSSSLPPSVVAGLIEAFRIIEHDHERRQRLRDNVAYFTGKLRSMGFDLGASCTAIVPILVGDDIITKQMTMELHREGLYVSAVAYPAVSKNMSRLRVSLMSSHTKQDLDFAIEKLDAMSRKYSMVSRPVA